MPNALMEAMSLGIPVVSSDCPCGGPSELIEDGKNGFLFEVNNELALINKMKEALSCTNINNIRAEEQKICETHSQEVIFNKWLEFIKKLV